MKFYYGVDPSEKREKLIKSEIAKPYIDEIIDFADKAITEDSTAFKMSDFMLYYETGNRSVFQNHYFGRRKKCSNIMFAYWLTQDEKYLKPLVDYISYICDEFTWCLPAHCELSEELSKNVIEKVDLFQAETAVLFAEIVMCVGDKLPEYILDRMRYEINRRILPTIQKSENETKYWWETCKMNWATVCGAGCVMAALYFGTEQEAEYCVNRFTGCLDSYLEGIGDDGCCKEGMGYWSYGMDYFVIMAQAVKIYTDGEIDYFKNPKMKALVAFPERIRMSDSKVAAFSDSDDAFYFKIGLMSFLKSVYSDMSLPVLKYGTRRGNVDSVSELLWFDENYQSDKLPCETNYLSDSEWYISRREKFSFAAKGGNNDEPHNHNDIGSFMISIGDETFISDLGSGEYVRQTFDPKTRYTFVQNSSRGHSVPIINGEYQQVGERFRSKNAKVSDTGFELNLECAYNPGIIEGINRQFTIDDNKVIMTDTFDFSPKTESVTERFVSKIKPEICDGYIDFGIARIVYDKERYVPSVSIETFVAHNNKDIVTVYLTDFAPASKEEKIFTFEFLM